MRQAELLRLGGRHRGRGGGRRGEHLRPAHDGLRCLLGCGFALLAGRLDQPGGDTELAHVEILVLLHEHLGGGEERIALAPRVLGEVVGELRQERGLIRGELLAVVRRQIEHVLVRDVYPRDRNGLVLVHLLRELARELHGLHVRTKGTPEHSLHE